LFPAHEIPLLGVSGFATDLDLRQASLAATETFLRHELASRVASELLQEFHVTRPRAFVGEVASGDRFIASRADRNQIKTDLPGLACVEMEGAAVAQVCHEYRVPFVVIRTISDAADEAASTDFPRFIRHVASVYSHGIVRNLLGRISPAETN